MTNEQIAEDLKKNIIDVETSKTGDPDKRILICHVSAEVFLKMAYLFVGVHGK